MDKERLSLYEKVADELDVKVELVDKIYTLYWEYIRKEAASFDLKADLSEEEFQKTMINFRLGKLGRLGCAYKRYLTIKKRRKEYAGIKTENKKNKADVHKDCDDL